MSKTESPGDLSIVGPQLIDAIPYRKPVVADPEVPAGISGSELVLAARDLSEGSKARQQSIDRNWLAVTEAVRRKVQTDPAMRRVAETLISAPLSEELPAQALAAYGEQDSRVRRLSTYPLLQGYVSLPSVPGELLVPDIRNARNLLHRGVAQTMLRAAIRENNPSVLHDHIDSTLHELGKNPGVSDAERDLASKRYAYARDVKMLGFSAEVLNHPLKDRLQETDGTLHGKLPSGTHIAVDKAAMEATPELLQPDTWHSRHQLKDRVYQVSIGSKQFILKERKTNRHADTKEHGHVDGLSSAEEYATAQYFHNLGPIYKNRTKLSWEKPVGYVEFPDGFQFCLFEADPKLGRNNPISELARQKIIRNRSDYEDEFVRIRARAEDIYATNPGILNISHDPSPPKKPRNPLKQPAYRRALRAQPKPETPISFEEFADLKTRATAGQASELLGNVMLQHGYVNSDRDGYSIVQSKEPGVLFEIIGFDFEYYKHDPANAQRIADNIQKANDNGLSSELAVHVTSYTPEERIRERMKEATLFALMEEAGYKLPR